MFGLYTVVSAFVINGFIDRSAGAAAHSLPGVEPKQKVEVNHLPNSQGHETKVSKRVLSNAKSPRGYQADDQPSKRRRLDKVAYCLLFCSGCFVA